MPDSHAIPVGLGEGVTSAFGRMAIRSKANHDLPQRLFSVGKEATLLVQLRASFCDQTRGFSSNSAAGGALTEEPTVTEGAR